MVPVETRNHMDQVPTPSAVFSMELPEQPKPQQGKMSPALEGPGAVGHGLCSLLCLFGSLHLRNTISYLLGFVLDCGDG